MTCDFCLDGRHVRCRTWATGCTCLRCAAERPKVPKPKREPKPRYTREAPGHYSKMNPTSNGKRGKPLGWSTLPDDVQADIELELRAGSSLSYLSRKHGVSRDRVRTIKERLERANG